MELFTKLKKILFDEVTTEIPVITKEDKKSENVKTKNVEAVTTKKPKEEKNEEVVIKKIETPKRERRVELLDDEPFDMPKLKEEAKQEVKRSTFTFPVFGDDEEMNIVTPKRRERKEDKPRENEKQTTREREKTKTVTNVEATKKKESVGYTNAFDYSYGKYKGDYKSSREQSHEILTKTLGEKDVHKTFTPSPIISPVYGILNENYKKEDIVAKKENKTTISEPLDLDSVRRKAYGTLEEEIESSLNRQFDEPQEAKRTLYEDDDDEGISIDDLLVGGEDEDDDFENMEESVMTIEEAEDDMELFDKLNEIDEDEEDETEDVSEVKIEPEVKEVPEDDEDDGEDLLEFLKSNDTLEKTVPPISSYEKDEEEHDAVEMKMEKTEDKDDSGEDEDLFDLIESIYEGKGEE